MANKQRARGDTASTKAFPVPEQSSDTYLNHGNKRHHLLHVLLQLWQGVQLTGNYFIIWQLTSTGLNRDEQAVRRTAIMKKTCPIINLSCFPINTSKVYQHP